MDDPGPSGVALVNGRVMLPDRLAEGLAVVCADGRIASVTETDHLAADVPRVDVGGRLVTPGLIDVHAHGALGWEFADASEPHALAAILDFYADCGITSVMPTLSSAPLEGTVAALVAIRRWREHPGSGTRLLGVHLEGPYLSQQQRGAHQPEHLRQPDDGSIDRLLEHAGVLGMVTLAPELPGALSLIRKLVALGIVVAVGHTDGRDDDLRAAADAGASHIIHLWSGQSATVREGAWRRPGVLEASLASDGLTAEIIADDRHLPATLMRLAYRCLGPRLCAVSDASSGTGLADGAAFGPPGSGRVVRDGVGMLEDGSSYAGSTTPLNAMVPILRQTIEIGDLEALRMVTSVPAGIAGVDDRKGAIAVGMDADIAVFNDDFSVWHTMIDGRWHRSGQTAGPTGVPTVHPDQL